jgi:hypothetical protein
LLIILVKFLSIVILWFIELCWFILIVLKWILFNCLFIFIYYIKIIVELVFICTMQMDQHLLNILDNFYKIMNLPNRSIYILLILIGTCSPEYHTFTIYLIHLTNLIDKSTQYFIRTYYKIFWYSCIFLYLFLYQLIIMFRFLCLFGYGYILYCRCGIGKTNNRVSVYYL